MKARRCHSTGFSLIELMLVLAIMGIISVWAAPRYVSAVDRYRADAAARRLVADIRYTHSRAMATGAVKQVIFTPGTSTYSVPGEANPNRPTQSFTIDLSSGPYAAKVVSTNLPGGSITFNGYGICVSAGSVIIQTGSCTKTVQVDTVTGSASIR